MLLRKPILKTMNSLCSDTQALIIIVRSSLLRYYALMCQIMEVRCCS